MIGKHTWLIYINIFGRYRYKYAKRDEYALADCEVSKERLLKTADCEKIFEICAHEHAIVRDRRLVDQSFVVVLTSLVYFTPGEILDNARLVKISLVV